MPNPGTVVAFSELATLGDELRKAGQKIVFTNGCFDILHAGHVQILGQARALGDLLVVAINSDASVRKLKGENRPIHCQEDRADVLLGLRAVDYVVVFDTDTPIDCIAALKPAIHVKGGDYTKDQLPETRVVEQFGGEVRILPLLPGRSSSSALSRL